GDDHQGSGVGHVLHAPVGPLLGVAPTRVDIAAEAEVHDVRPIVLGIALDAPHDGPVVPVHVVGEKGVSDRAAGAGGAVAVVDAGDGRHGHIGAVPGARASAALHRVRLAPAAFADLVVPREV